jgi:tetratricopeptide (TPR) repeat protein
MVLLALSVAASAHADDRKRRGHKEKPAAEASEAAAQTSAAQGAEPAPESPHDREARGLFKAGEAAFSEGRFDAAIEYFQRAYELSHRPILLLNIASAADRMRNDALSLEALEHYLADVPDAENRGQIEARITILREQLAQKERATSTAEAAPESARVQPAAEQKGREQPKSRVWPWVVTGAGAAMLAAGGVFLALGANAGNHVSDAKAGSSFADVRDDYDHAGSYPVVGGVLAGAGALVVTGGLVWLFVGRDKPEKSTLSAAFTGRGLVLSGKF